MPECKCKAPPTLPGPDPAADRAGLAMTSPQWRIHVCTHVCPSPRTACPRHLKGQGRWELGGLVSPYQGTLGVSIPAKPHSAPWGLSPATAARSAETPMKHQCPSPATGRSRGQAPAIGATRAWPRAAKGRQGRLVPGEAPSRAAAGCKEWETVSRVPRRARGRPGCPLCASCPNPSSTLPPCLLLLWVHGCTRAQPCVLAAT